MRILLQNGVFTEDEEDPKTTETALKKYFEVVAVDDQTVMSGDGPVNPE